MIGNAYQTIATIILVKAFLKANSVEAAENVKLVYFVMYKDQSNVSHCYKINNLAILIKIVKLILFAFPL